MTTTSVTDNGSNPRIARVLLVEGDPEEAVRVKGLLTSEEAPYLVEHVTHLAEATARPRETHYDAILLDLKLPDGYGVDAVTRMADASQGVPLVVMTDGAGSHDAIALSCIEAGAQELLCKEELDADTLRRAIGHAISRGRADDLRRRLEHSDRLAAIGQLAAGVAHEVNNPAAFVMANQQMVVEHLATIKRALAELEGTAGAAEILERHGVYGILNELDEMIRDNLEGMRRIATIVRNLQAFARMGHEAPEMLDLNEIVRSASQIVSSEIRPRARLELALGTIPRIAGDRGKLTQVLVNLLINAAHAIAEGNPERNVIRLSTEHSGDYVITAVEDTGGGIPAKNLKRIFQPFFTTKPRDRGTGLGLSVSAEIVARHGGRINVDSRVGEGTRFEIHLPVETGLTVAGSGPTEPAPPTEDRIRILLIDDEPSLRRALQRMLEPSHDVVLAASGTEGLQRIENDPEFDLILCDLIMPDLDGPSVYEALQKDRPSLLDRLVFISGGAFTERARRFVDERGPVLLEKPITSEVLLDTIRRFRRRDDAG